MINYNVNNLIDKTLKRFYKTYALTLDTDDLIEQLNNLANDNQDTDSNDFEI